MYGYSSDRNYQKLYICTRRLCLLVVHLTAYLILKNQWIYFQNSLVLINGYYMFKASLSLKLQISLSRHRLFFQTFQTERKIKHSNIIRFFLSISGWFAFKLVLIIICLNFQIARILSSRQGSVCKCSLKRNIQCIFIENIMECWKVEPFSLKFYQNFEFLKVKWNMIFCLGHKMFKPKHWQTKCYTKTMHSVYFVF